MANSILLGNVVGINDIEKLKDIIYTHLKSTPFYHHKLKCNILKGNIVSVVNDARVIAGLAQFPLYANVDPENTISYEENVKLLNRWLQHYDTAHGMEMISVAVSQLFAEVVFMFRQIGRPVYFTEYKSMLMKLLGHEEEARQFLETLLQQD